MIELKNDSRTLVKVYYKNRWEENTSNEDDFIYEVVIMVNKDGFVSFRVLSGFYKNSEDENYCVSSGEVLCKKLAEKRMELMEKLLICKLTDKELEKNYNSIFIA